MTYRVLSLFAGIGGFDLGLERTGGFRTVAFCEIEPFARCILAKHWPEVSCYEDVRELTADRLRADGIIPNVIVAGFPCQDISYAGTGAGLGGKRSGLFFEVARLVGELGPDLVLLENVSALLSRGLAEVLGTLASLGFDAEWHCIPASALGAHHRRDRIWIMAYPGHGSGARPASGQYRDARQHPLQQENGQEGPVAVVGGGEDVAHAASIGHPRQGLLTQWCRPEANGAREAAHALASGQLGQWSPEPELGRVANGVPDRAHRLRCLGNAVVPQIPELIGRAILAAEAKGAA